MICEYGCGQEVKYQFKNGKWCCSRSWNSCPKKRRKQGDAERGKHHRKHKPTTEETKRRRKESAIKRFQNPEERERFRKFLVGKKKKPHTKEHKKRIGDGVKKADKEGRRNKEGQRQYMLNGGAVYVNSKVKNPSKPQIHLYEILRRVYPEVYLNPPLYHLRRQCNPDILIPKLELIVEYNGARYHQDKQKDLERLKMLKDDGWKVLEYNGTMKKDIYPIKEQVLEDIERILKERE